MEPSRPWGRCEAPIAGRDDLVPRGAVMTVELPPIDGLLIDIDGVLTVSWAPIPGAPGALRRLDELGVPFRLLTNTTELSRKELRRALIGAGFAVRLDQLLTAPVLTASYLREHHPGGRCFLLGSDAAAQDLEGIDLVGR